MRRMAGESFTGRSANGFGKRRGAAGAAVTRPPPDTATTHETPPVTNSRHTTAGQLAKLRNRLLTSRNSDSELRLEHSYSSRRSLYALVLGLSGTGGNSGGLSARSG